MYNPQLDTFICVAEAGSFSRAAQALYITPTAVIKQMNLLESRLGITLFNRTHQGLTLTRAGESLLRDARHIVQYSKESVARARLAERSERRVVRVGVSLMTPSTPLARLWPEVRRRCLGMSMQLVTFENGPEAARSLADLGQAMDVVVGVFDDDFLAEHSCSGLELSQEPLCCAVAMDDPLAERELITLDDLRDRSLMLIRRTWNAQMDRLRDRIREGYPDVTVVDFQQYLAEVFNRCADEKLALVTLPIWRDVHPMLRTLPTDWGLSVSYGVLHAPNPSEHVAEFLDALRETKGTGSFVTSPRHQSRNVTK